MELSLNYHLQQEQKMSFQMTHHLSQAIYLLQYSTMDLYTYIQSQVIENPLLEIRENLKKKPVKNIYEFYSKEKKISLQEHCKEQLEDFKLDRNTKWVCNYLIENLDENGYLDHDVIENMNQLGVSSSTRIEKALEIIQSFDPVGIGARSIKECLKIQLAKKKAPLLALNLAANFLEDIAFGSITKVKSYLNVSSVELKEALAFIQSCHPRPGSIFSYDTSPYIYPDIIIKVVGKEYQVCLNEGILPQLNINDSYLKLKLKGLHQENMKEWYQSAYWLIKGLSQRQNTLKRVVGKVIEKQRVFLDKGIKYLKPLTLIEVANELGVHESTISRIVQNKYIQTPRGIVPFSYFFSNGIQTKGQVLSSQYVKYRIRELIVTEDKTKPFSDQQITDLLKKEGVYISRRTVMKYREKLQILPSTKRHIFA